jgi:metal-responsive CopG/Arc/MetJ family transcriptional regulator
MAEMEGKVKTTVYIPEKTLMLIDFEILYLNKGYKNRSDFICKAIMDKLDPDTKEKFNKIMEVL